MKKSTTNKLNMYQSVHTVLNEYASAWQTVPAFVNAAGKFNEKLDLLRSRVSEQSSITTGVTADKRIRIAGLLDRILPAQHALMLYGRDTGNVMLQERNKKSKSYLAGLNINKFIARCDELKLDLEAFGSQLSDYGFNSQSVGTLIDQLSGLDELGNSPRKAILKRKNITDSIQELEHAISELLRVDLDGLVLLFKVTNPEFFSAFRNSRKIIDYRGPRHGTLVEPDDGNVPS